MRGVPSVWAMTLNECAMYVERETRALLAKIAHSSTLVTSTKYDVVDFLFLAIIRKPISDVLIKPQKVSRSCIP
jgi:hypothetical protein